MPKLARPNAEHDPDPIDIGIGLRIRARRKAMKMNQPTLGGFLGVSYQQVQKYEIGANRISSANLVRIAHALGCSIAELAGDAGEGSQSGPGIELFAERGAAELLEAYRAIPTPAARKLIIELARTLAGK